MEQSLFTCSLKLQSFKMELEVVVAFSRVQADGFLDQVIEGK